jgi:hypothetical protein
MARAVRRGKDWRWRFKAAEFAKGAFPGLPRDIDGPRLVRVLAVLGYEAYGGGLQERASGLDSSSGGWLCGGRSFSASLRFLL